uniref:Peptidoglycan-recognition protein n=1 Tax=Musca domestica TaxID=7370 RepID=A0A1I8N480_MUSDO
MVSKTLFGLFAFLFCAQAVFGITIISKAEWGGAPATSKTTLSNNLQYAVIHHTEGAACSDKASCSQQMRNVQHYHQKTLRWADIGYNFLIGGDGNIYEGRGWNVVGAHATNWNSKSLGISFIGNYHNYKPSAAQINAAKNLLAAAVSRGQIVSGYVLYGHRQVGSTDCPGTHLWNEIKTWAHWMDGC